MCRTTQSQYRKITQLRKWFTTGNCSWTNYFRQECPAVAVYQSVPELVVRQIMGCGVGPQRKRSNKTRKAAEPDASSPVPHTHYLYTTMKHQGWLMKGQWRTILQSRVNLRGKVDSSGVNIMAVTPTQTWTESKHKLGSLPSLPESGRLDSCLMQPTLLHRIRAGTNKPTNISRKPTKDQINTCVQLHTEYV